MALSTLSTLIPFVPALYAGLSTAELFACPEAPKDEHEEDIEEQLRERFSPFLIEQGVRADLKIEIFLHPLFCFARGSNWITLFPAKIVVPPALSHYDLDMVSWLIKHEIAHIKYNDLFTIPLVTTISALAIATLQLNLTARLITSLALALLASLFAFQIYTWINRYREAKADDFALQYATEKELLAGARLIYMQQALEIGDDHFHPSCSLRLAKIEAKIRTLGISWDIIKERADIEANIERLKPLFWPGDIDF